MRTLIMFAFIATNAAASALADAPIKFIGTANGVGKGNVGDITNVAKWGDGETALSPNSDYIIDNGKYCGFGGTGSFPGQSLAVGVVGGNNGYIEAMTTAGTFDFGTLILNNGQLYSGAGYEFNVGGDVTVNASAEAPFAFRFKGQSGGKYNFTGDFIGSGNLRVYKSSQSGGYDYLLVRFKGDLSGFGGTMEIGLPSATSNSSDTTYRSPVLFGDTFVGGNLVVNPCGVIGVCGTGTDYYGEFSVANLSFGAGSSIRLGVTAATSTTVRVIQSLTLPENGKIYLDVRAMPDVCTAERRIPILVAPMGSGLATDKFQLCCFTTTAAVWGKLAACSLDVDETGGNEILYIVVGKYTYLNTKDDSTSGSSWTTESYSHWKSSSSFAGNPFDADTTYVDYNKQMLSPGGGASTTSTFGGKRLAFYSENAFAQLRSSTLIDDLIMMDGSFLKLHATAGIHLYGNVTLADPTDSGKATVKFRSGADRTSYIDAELSGPANLTLTGTKDAGASTSASAIFVLNGVNSNFTGRLTVANEQDDSAANTTLRVSDVRSLGGARSSFAYNALTLLNYSKLRVDADLNFAEPTRGFYASGTNTVTIPNAAHTFAFASQATLNGTLVKEGAGTLALGGMLKFSSSQSDTPVADMNVLQVAAGRIRPASKGGADGLTIAFASGTGIVLAPLSETNADVVRYGLYNVKWAVPFDLTATDGKLDVALDLPADSDEIPASFSFGVCTVQSDAAGALIGNINLPSLGSRVLSIDPISNGDNTVTFKAVYAKRGFVVTFK